MDIQKLVSSIFPAEIQIPPDVRIDRPVIQTEYLINGQIRHWSGPQNEVLSPICFKTPEGAKRFVLGSFPMLSQKEALEALDSACGAYDSGQGEWPTMPVRERIGRMEKNEMNTEIFTAIMRDRSSNFLSTDFIL